MNRLLHAPFRGVFHQQISALANRLQVNRLLSNERKAIDDKFYFKERLQTSIEEVHSKAQPAATNSASTAAENDNDESEQLTPEQIRAREDSKKFITNLRRKRADRGPMKLDISSSFEVTVDKSYFDDETARRVEKRQQGGDNRPKWMSYEQIKQKDYRKRLQDFEEISDEADLVSDKQEQREASERSSDSASFRRNEAIDELKKSMKRKDRLNFIKRDERFEPEVEEDFNETPKPVMRSNSDFKRKDLSKRIQEEMQRNEEPRRTLERPQKTHGDRVFADKIQKSFGMKKGEKLPVAPKELSLLEQTVKTIQPGDFEPDIAEDKIEDIIKNLKPAYRPFVYNLAYFANDSKTLRKFIEMGIQIREWDKERDVAEFVLRLDFERHVAPFLIFLHDLGIKTRAQSRIIQKNPMLLKERLDDLQIRVNYLESKKFSKEDICEIIAKSPKWLSLSVDVIDTNLGWLQKEFALSGTELRKIIAEFPKLVVKPLKIVTDMRFYLKEILMYNDDEIKALIKADPKLFNQNQKNIEANYDFLVHVVKFNRQKIIEFPDVLYMPFTVLKSRYAFLKSLGRDQFDPSKPHFVSLKEFCTLDDKLFAKKLAKSNFDEFKKFLRTA